MSDPNIEAWAVVLRDALYCADQETREAILSRAHELIAADRRQRGKIMEMNADDLGPGVLFRTEAMKLKASVIASFMRSIRNNHSPREAGRILFAHHARAEGSGYIADYLDGVPGVSIDQRKAGT